MQGKNYMEQTNSEAFNYYCHGTVRICNVMTELANALKHTKIDDALASHLIDKIKSNINELLINISHMEKFSQFDPDSYEWIKYIRSIDYKREIIKDQT